MEGQTKRSREQLSSYPASLVLQDVLTLHGSQFKYAHCIVASPPCQFFSYTAMPWSRAKRLAEEVRNDPARLEQELALFKACFRIQREASEAAGRYIPMVVENVVGAQRWLGLAKWHYGSFYLWGDVPVVNGSLVSSSEFGADRLDIAKRGRSKNDGGSWFAVANNTTSGHSRNPVHELAGFKGAKTMGHVNQRDGFQSTAHLTRQFESDRIREGGAGVMVADGRKGYVGGLGRGRGLDPASQHSSRSDARKAASAMIAKIPFPLALHIARAFKAWKEK
jgi:hypothetical protein